MSKQIFQQLILQKSDVQFLCTRASYGNCVSRVCLSVCLSVRLSRYSTDPRSGEIETLGFHHNYDKCTKHQFIHLLTAT